MSEPDEADLSLRIHQAMAVIRDYAATDGAHHKHWVIDQVVRALMGSNKAYQEWVEEWETDENGERSYEWEAGIAP